MNWLARIVAVLCIIWLGMLARKAHEVHGDFGFVVFVSLMQIFIGVGLVINVLCEQDGNVNYNNSWKKDFMINVKKYMEHVLTVVREQLERIARYEKDRQDRQ